MYTVKFTKKSNPEVYDCFVRALENIKPIVGPNVDALKQGLLDHYGAKLIDQEYNPNQNVTEYVFHFPDEKTYAWFLLKV